MRRFLPIDTRGGYDVPESRVRSGGGPSAPQAAAACRASSTVAANPGVDNCVPERLEFVGAHRSHAVTDMSIAVDTATDFFVVRPDVNMGEDVLCANRAMSEQKFLIPEFRCCHHWLRLLRSTGEIQTCLACQAPTCHTNT
jgi:hypothetical protein